jgi:TRAP-type C4-dicarboxylate transport system permease small subunit
MSSGGICSFVVPVGGSELETCVLDEAAANKCDGTKTAFGELSNDPGVVANQLLRVGTFMAGGIALVIMVFAAYKIISSRGNPDALQSGRELFTSALIGLLFIIFAVVILQLIGRDIIGIPGFGFRPSLSTYAFSVPGSAIDIGSNTGLNPSINSFGAIISAFLPAILGIAGIISFLFFLLGGFRYLVARGDSKAVDSARKTIASALIGLLIIVGLFVLINIIQSILHIQITLISAAYAQNPGQIDLGNSFKFGSSPVSALFPSLGKLVSNILVVVIPVAGIIFFFMLLWGGLRYMLSMGDDKAVSSARGIISTALIGLLIILGSFLIIRVIQAITGITLLT